MLSVILFTSRDKVDKIHNFVFLSICSLPESPGDVPDYPMFISIGDWLDSIKMSQYKNNFLAAGFTTLDSVTTMSIECVPHNTQLFNIR